MKEISFKNDVLPLKDKIFRLALRITLNREEAEDIVQDTLIKVWNKRFEWQSINSLEAFALTICRNLSLDLKAKKESQNVTFDEAVHDRADIAPPPDERMIRGEGTSLVMQLIDRLSEKQRTIITLRDVEGKTYKEIAEVMQIGESDVKVNLFRARNKIKEQYLKAINNGL